MLGRVAPPASGRRKLRAGLLPTTAVLFPMLVEIRQRNITGGPRFLGGFTPSLALGV